MKKIITTVLIMFSFCTVTWAQRINLELGAQIGLNGSYVTANGGYNSSSTGGFNAGVSADYYFSETWSVKAKLNYDQKGWGDGTLVDQAGNTTQHVDYQLNYLTLPVMANWHFGRTQNLYLNFGPYVGFLLSANDNYHDPNVKQLFNSVDGGLAAGFGVQFPVSDSKKLFIECDTQNGLANINRDSSGDLIQNVRESINIGINF